MSSSRKANYKLIPTIEFLKNLERLDRQMNQRIISSIENLSGNPFLGKPLRGELRALYSLRIGKYRVIYSVDTRRQEVVIHAAKHGSKVYG